MAGNFFLKKCVNLFGVLTHCSEFRQIKSSKTNQNEHKKSIFKFVRIAKSYF